MNTLIFKAKCEKCNKINEIQTNYIEIENNYSYECVFCGVENGLNVWCCNEVKK